jgi:hypothetical protein
MRYVSRKTADVANNPWFIVVTGLASLISFIAYLYEKIDPQFGLLSKALLASAVCVLFVGYVYSIKVRAENMAHRDIARIYFEINQIYREKLHEMFCSGSPVRDPTDLLREEQTVLRSICQRIENIFARLIGRTCMVTIKLVSQAADQPLVAQSYVRSQELCLRDRPTRSSYAVGTGENNGFDKALQARGDGKPAHFYSADLSKEPDYSNQRQHYVRYYKSVLVLPIRGPKSNATQTGGEQDLIGFLCLDTMSVNRLNSGFHLYILAALANQLYNFMSLMRGRYTVLVG